ncbi:transposase [Nosocomiicoccus ampullae]|uniref:transposase n=1 Tax=Nosocomiicoccus ampullae TaxID=489910 RepID=UPI00254F9C3E|nr:transposase [Nosocomiicoccus ampullae]MDK6862874.1 transposase [Nosocomiicoccus ampullae]
MKSRKHSFEFKIKVVNEYLPNEGNSRYLDRKYHVEESLIRSWFTQYNQLSYRETAIHFGIKNYSTIANWQRKLIDGGTAALEDTKGRTRKYI